MSKGPHFEPEPFQVVSDLGQLRVWEDPEKVRILRILQHKEATTTTVAELVELPEPIVAEHVDELCDLEMLKVVGHEERNGHRDRLYRATARIYRLRPEPIEAGAVMAAVASATMESVKEELVTSLTEWPDQRLNYEGRRTRMSQARAVEFNERLLELISEFWGTTEEPIDGSPDDPLMAFVGFWYRFPEKKHGSS